MTTPKKDPDFPQLTKLRAFDRQAHIERSLAAGLTREEAEAEADRDLAEREAEGRP